MCESRRTRWPSKLGEDEIGKTGGTGQGDELPEEEEGIRSGKETRCGQAGEEVIGQ